MPRTEVEIQADIDRLRKAIGSPDQRVTADGNTREARTVQDNVLALSQLESELETVQATKTRHTGRRFRTRSGW